jgi:Transposase domain (DUF772)
VDSPKGQPPVPPARLALAVILQAYAKVSDDEVIEATVMDRRWQLVLDCLGAEEPPFSKGTLVGFRKRLIERDLDRRLIERTVELAARTKGFGARALRAALDSSPLWGAGRVEDTFNLVGHALRKALGVIAVLQGRGQAAGITMLAQQAGTPELAASSLKAALDADWDDPAARDAALARVLGLLDQVEAFTAGQAADLAATTAVAAARQVRDQDVDLSGPVPALRRGVARDRRISVEDDQMRHGRKSRSVLFDGYKRHVLRDLDTGLVPVVGITPANAPEASVTGDITADLDAAGWHLSELHIDRANLSSDLVRDRGPDLQIFCKAWRVRNTGGRFAKDQFTLDFAARRLTCPAGAVMPFEPGKIVRFPKDTCAACPLRDRCTTSSNGRSVAIHPDERCSPSCASASTLRKDARNCANASLSSTPWPTSGTGRAAAPATWAPARTCSTCAASPWSTTSTSSPASLLPTVTSSPPDSYLTDALAHVIHPRGVAGKRAHPRPADACAPGRRHQPA